MTTFAIPLRTRFRGITLREGIVWRGGTGWAEFSPFWDYPPHECLPWLRCALEAAEEGWPDAIRSRIPVNVTVPAVGPERAQEFVLASGGCRTAKVKVAEPGQSLAQEVDRLSAVRDALGVDGAIRIDANGAWDVETARDRLAILDRAAGGLEYAEQPCRTVPELARLRRSTRVPIAADESIRRAGDPMAVVRADAADLIVLKVQPLGGVRACLELAEATGLPVVVSSALETEIGIRAGLALAAALPELPYACGLATAQLLTADVTGRIARPVDGFLPVTDVHPDPEALDALTADEATDRRWRTRLAEVEALG